MPRDLAKYGRRAGNRSREILREPAPMIKALSSRPRAATNKGAGWHGNRSALKACQGRNFLGLA